MKISSIPQLYRDLNRSVAIVGVLSKYGLADWIQRLELDFAKGLFKDRDGNRLADLSLETRIRMALVELGPTFIKFGQILSTRPDLIGPHLANELTALQEDTPADPAEVVRKILEDELGQSLGVYFEEFCDTPMASASIGQVHEARLTDGRNVVVKVQHDKIQERIRVDLDILAGMAELAEAVDELRPYRPRETVAEFQRCLLRELDFGREERNLIEFANNFKGDPQVHFPAPISELCTGRILTMERLRGIRLGRIAELEKAGYDLQEIAKRGAEVFLKMIFEHGFYHADPHAGNLMVLDGGVIGVLDCGMVGRVDEPLREQIEELLLAIYARDAVQLRDVVMRIGQVPHSVDTTALQYDLAEFVSHYVNVPLERLDLSKLLTEMTELLRQYHILLPPPLAMLVKSLIMLEGTGRMLHPRLSLTEMVSPFQQKLLWQRFSPSRQFKKLYHTAREWERLATRLPRQIGDLLDQAQAGRVEVHLEHHGLEPAVNRLVMGLFASAIFVGGSLMTTRDVPPLLFGHSILGIAALMTSIVLGFRVFWAIRRSGRLDRQASPPRR